MSNKEHLEISIDSQIRSKKSPEFKVINSKTIAGIDQASIIERNIIGKVYEEDEEDDREKKSSSEEKSNI